MQPIANFLTSTAARAPNPNRTKVRRYSYARGREGVFWRSVKRQDMKAIVLAARRYERQTKAKGSRNGALGHIALEILDYMTNLVDYRTGRLEPSLDYLMEKLGRSRDAIVRALKALRTHGFVDWIRRYVPTGAQGYGQPKYHQTSNAYRLSLPQRAKRMLGRYGQAAPLPDDFSQMQEQAEADREDMLSSLSREDRIDIEMGEDCPIAQSLKRLSLAMKERESAKRSESLSKISIIGESDRLPPDIR